MDTGWLAADFVSYGFVYREESLFHIFFLFVRHVINV